MSHRRPAAAGSASGSTDKKSERLDPETLPFVGSRSSSHVVGSLSLESGAATDHVEMMSSSSDHPAGDLVLGDGSSPGDSGHVDDGLDPEQRYQVEIHRNRTKHWRESPFAAGLVPPTWRDEKCRTRHQHGDHELQADETGCLCCTAHACPRAGRVGNMVVLRSSTEWVEEVDVEEDGQERVRRYPRPRLDCVVGPYWPMMAFVTYPLILGVSGWTLVTKVIPGRISPLMVFGWAVLTIGLVTALALTACCDPGIQYKHPKPPAQHENQWRWTDRAHSYRPRNAFYDVDTGVVIEGFDHTCPWTGTAIGRKNMLPFQVFVCLVFVCMMMNIFLLTGVFDANFVKGP